MQKATWNVTLSADRETVKIDILIDGKQNSWSESTASELQGLIDVLVAVRANMADEVPRELDPGSRLPTIVDPVWRIVRNPDTKQVELCLRHPGSGWTKFVLPEESYAVLSDWVKKDAEK